LIDALYIAATGMQSQQLHVDTIANNIANVNTTGYKKGRVGFADLMMRENQRVSQPTADEMRAGALGGTQRIGAGVGIASLSKVFDGGDLKKTENAFDVAIQGDGFLEIAMPDGSRAFTRGGTLKVNRDGMLVTQAGHVLKPSISIPENTQAIVIGADGRVLVRQAGQNTQVEVGQLEMVRFNAPTQLSALGDNLYRSTEGSGEALPGRPGEDGMGTVAQGFIEGSNVKMVEEVVNLMVAQRAYEASVKVVQASDEMLGMINNLRK
jgi:flagellar basal-body rod protein FlgG